MVIYNINISIEFPSNTSIAVPGGHLTDTMLTVLHTLPVVGLGPPSERFIPVSPSPVSHSAPIPGSGGGVAPGGTHLHSANRALGARRANLKGCHR